MQIYLLIAVGGLALIWYVGAAIATFIGDGLNNMDAQRAATRAKKENNKKLASAAAEKAAFEEFRANNPARIVGIPNPDAHHRIFKALDELTAAANNLRPQLSELIDSRFKTTKFPAHLFAFARPHPVVSLKLIRLASQSPQMISPCLADRAWWSFTRAPTSRSRFQIRSRPLNLT